MAKSKSEANEKKGPSYRKISTQLWRDRKFRKLSRLPCSGQALWLVLISGPNTTQIPGIVEGTPELIAATMRWSIEETRAAFAEIIEEGMAEVDEDAGLIWLPNSARHNPCASPNQAITWARATQFLPECDTLDRAISALYQQLKGMSDAFAQAFAHAYREALGHAMPEGLTDDMSESAFSIQHSATAIPPNPPRGAEGSAALEVEGREADESPEVGYEGGSDTIPAEVLDAFDAARTGKMPPAKRPPEPGTVRKWERIGSPGPDDIADRTRRAGGSAKYANPDRADPLSFGQLMTRSTWEAVAELAPPGTPPPEQDGLARARAALGDADRLWREGSLTPDHRALAVALEHPATADEAAHLASMLEGVANA